MIVDRSRLCSARRTWSVTDRAGAALLEAIAALAILSTGIIALVSLGVQSVDAVARARLADEEAARASAFFDAVSLWTREDLDRRLGNRPQGGWRLDIQRSHPRLYTVVLTDSSGARDILRTALYRPVALPEAADAP